MTKQKQMTEQELDQVSGGGVWTKLDGLSRRRGFHDGSVAQGRLGVIETGNNLQEACANGTFFKSKAGRKGNELFRGCIPIDECL